MDLSRTDDEQNIINMHLQQFWRELKHFLVSNFKINLLGLVKHQNDLASIMILILQSCLNRWKNKKIRKVRWLSTNIWTATALY